MQRILKNLLISDEEFAIFNDCFCWGTMRNWLGYFKWRNCEYEKGL